MNLDYSISFSYKIFALDFSLCPSRYNGILNPGIWISPLSQNVTYNFTIWLLLGRNLTIYHTITSWTCPTSKHLQKKKIIDGISGRWSNKQCGKRRKSWLSNNSPFPWCFQMPSLSEMSVIIHFFVMYMIVHKFRPVHFFLIQNFCLGFLSLSISLQWYFNSLDLDEFTLSDCDLQFYHLTTAWPNP